jgi:hypothetical protein
MSSSRFANEPLYSVPDFMPSWARCRGPADAAGQVDMDWCVCIACWGKGMNSTHMDSPNHAKGLWNLFGNVDPSSDAGKALVEDRVRDLTNGRGTTPHNLFAKTQWWQNWAANQPGAPLALAAAPHAAAQAAPPGLPPIRLPAPKRGRFTDAFMRCTDPNCEGHEWQIVSCPSCWNRSCDVEEGPVHC